MVLKIDAIGKSDVMGRDGFTWWVGEVEDNVDPQKIGRVRVRIIGWYTGAGRKEAYTQELPTADLPWAVVLLPNDQAGIKNTGSKTELQVGAQVIGFFLDGEEAQLPVVLGNFQHFRTASDPENEDDSPDTTVQTGATTVADPTLAKTDNDMPEQAKALNGEVAHQGNSFVAVATETPGDENGGEEKSRGVISQLNGDSPGNVYTNPIHISNEAFAIGDGLTGPRGEGFEKDLERMLTEFGQLSGSIAKDAENNYVSIITGKKIRNDLLTANLERIKVATSNMITGIMSSLKNIMASAIESVVDAILSLIPIPMGIVSKLLAFASSIAEKFCMFETSHLLGVINGALGNITSFADSIADNVVTKVVGGFAASVQDTVDGVLSKIQGGVAKITDVMNKGLAALNTIKGKFDIVTGVFQKLLKFDFKNLNWGGLVKILLGILAALLGNKDCGRKYKPPKQKFWLPMLGTSTCDSVPEFLQQEYEIQAGGETTGSGSGWQGKSGDFFSTLLQGLKTENVKAETFMNGAMNLQISEPGKEQSIIQHTGGQTTIALADGNQHRNMPGNDTKVVGRDECTNVKGNKVVTIEGDYTLKVMGDFNIEIGGVENKFMSQGSNDAEEVQQNKSSITYAGDHTVQYEGNYELQAPNITFNAVQDITLEAQGSISNKATGLLNSISGELINECAWKTEFINSVHYKNVALMNMLPGITGVVNIVKGPTLSINGTGLGTNPMPAAQINVIEATTPGGIVDIINGTTGGRLTMVNTGKGGIGEFVNAAGGAIMNNVTNGVATYNVGTGVYTAGCGGGPAQFYGLPILLN